MLKPNLVASIILVNSTAMAADVVVRPNIVVMMTDDQRADYMSSSGHPFIKTPNMDRIGKEGAAFKNMFVTNSLCAPSRATLMSGLYSHANGVIDNMGTKLKADITWMPDVLRANGYEVGFVGKSHVPGHFRDRKWDYYFGFTGQGTYQNARIAESLPDGTIGPDKPYEGWMDDITIFLERADDFAPLVEIIERQLGHGRQHLNDQKTSLREIGDDPIRDIVPNFNTR